MKKGLLLVAATVCCFLFLAGTGFAGYLVSGAPDPYSDANGLYCETVPTSEESPLYEKEGGSWAIQHYPAIPPHWSISKEAGGMGYELIFVNDDDGETLPLSGWYRYIEPYPSVPIVISEQSCEKQVPQGGNTAVPTITEWGAILLSLLLLGSAVFFIRRNRAKS